MKLAMMIRAADPMEQDLCARLGVRYAITKAAPELTGIWTGAWNTIWPEMVTPTILRRPCNG